MKPQTIPAAEAAIALGVSRQRVHQLIEAGLLVGKLVDGRCQVDLASVKARIAAKPRSGPPRIKRRSRDEILRG